VGEALIYIYVYIYIRVYIYTYTYMYIYIYIRGPTDRQTERRDEANVVFGGCVNASNKLLRQHL